MNCSIEACIKPSKARGWCSTHHQRWFRHGDPLTIKSKGGHNKGIVGIVKRSDETKEKLRHAALKNEFGKWKRSEEQKTEQTQRLLDNHAGGWNRGLKGPTVTDETRKKLSASLKRAYDEGRRQGNWITNGGNAKWFDHVKPSGESVRVQGTYELRFAIVMDKLGWQWSRFNRQEAVVYYLEGRKRHYGPDFTINNGEFYVEVKGWWTELARMKAEAFRNSGRTLIIVNKEVLKQFEGSI